MLEITTKNISYKKEEIDQIINNFFEVCFSLKTIFLFFGDVGAGKTTMIKKILLNKFGIQSFGSPTFTYVNSYKNDSVTVHHLDLYRLKSIREFYDLGLQTLFSNDQAIFFIEWPEILINNLDFVDDKFKIFKINLSYDIKNPNKRILKMEKYCNNFLM